MSLLGKVLVVHAAGPSLPRFGVCMRDGERLVGRKPLTVVPPNRTPKQIRDVHPKYPKVPAKTVMSGMWIGEALVDGTGKVVKVWPIREPRLTPPFPPFSRAIANAILKWRFEPLLVGGEPAPLCMTVTVNIDF